MLKTKQNQYQWLIFNCLLLFILCCLCSSDIVQGQTPETTVTLTWTTDTYVPSDYPGKPLPTAKSNIEVAAHIDDSSLSPEQMRFYWFLDRQVVDNNPKPGNQTLRFELGEITNKETTVRVEIKDGSRNLVAFSDYLIIKPSQPEVVIKTQTPFWLGDSMEPGYQILPNQEAEFIAQPYFFNIKNPDELNYSWNLQGETAQQNTSRSPNILVLKIGQITNYIEQSLKVLAKNNAYILEEGQGSAKLVLTPQQ